MSYLIILDSPSVCVCVCVCVCDWCVMINGILIIMLCIMSNNTTIIGVTTNTYYV